MKTISVEGGKKLFGKVEICPAKNSCLPIIASSVMLNKKVVIENAPNITDVVTMADIIKDLGGNYSFNNNLNLYPENINDFFPSSEICSLARASFFVAGSLLTRFKKAVMPLPGGCKIGKRPVDIHINCFKKLGVKVKEEDNFIILDGENMYSGAVELPYPSVGATVNIINASVFLKGKTIIKNSAREPEIFDLCNFLNRCGCNIKGGGSSEIVIEGVKEENNLREIFYKPICDRIEAGTYLTAVCACGGEIELNYDCPKTILSVTKQLTMGGAKLYFLNDKICMRAEKPFLNSHIIADVYPFIPTDMQPQFTALMLTGKGNGSVTDNVFKTRFMYTDELNKMGADIIVKDNTAYIKGERKLHGANMKATDLRGGASLIIASLCCKEKSIISNFDVVLRGYKNIVSKLKNLGATICFEGEN